MWLDGSRIVHGWHRAGSSWVRRNWIVEFDASPTFTWNAPDSANPDWRFVNPAHPMAAHPDQVFVGGHSLRQVGTPAQVKRGSFYVDYASHELYVGTDPANREVRASTLAKAMTIQSAGVTIDGINLRRFAPSVPAMGAITVERSDVLLSHMMVRDMSTIGAFVMGAHDRLRDVTFRHNGQMGFMASHATGLRVDRVAAIDNDTELFNQSPAAGGAKFGRSTDVRVVRSRFSHNHANGCGSTSRRTASRWSAPVCSTTRGHGISVEVSGHALIAGNVIADNRGNGIKVNDTDHVQLWNNTFVGNGRPINVVQDDRDVNPGGSYHDRSLPLPWVNRYITVRNNIVARAGSGSDCLLCVQDYTGRWTAKELHETADSNVYQRIDARSPSKLVLWSKGAAAPALFATMKDFARSTGQEASHLVLTGQRAVSATYRPAGAVRGRAGGIAMPLPRWIADLTGRRSGSRWLGAWFGS